MIVNYIKTQLFDFLSVTQSVCQSGILALSFILNIFYVYDWIELKFSMIVTILRRNFFISTHSLSQSGKLEISFILNIFYIYDPIELKFSMIVRNIKTELFYFHSLTQSVQEISFILNIFYVHDPIELKCSMIDNTQIF